MPDGREQCCKKNTETEVSKSNKNVRLLYAEDTLGVPYPWILLLLLFQLLNRVDSSATLLTVARWAPLSMGFPRQEYWSGQPFPSTEESNLSLALWPVGSLPPSQQGFSFMFTQKEYGIKIICKYVYKNSSNLFNFKIPMLKCCLLFI